MELVARFWATVTYVMSFLTFSSIGQGDTSQHPLKNFPGPLNHLPAVELRPKYPDFGPPGGDPDDDFVCKYPEMVGWKSCSTPDNRECWLRHHDGREYNIKTNYEDEAPQGIDRYYSLDVANMDINLDGLNTHASLFNKKYPGPWVQACWGDRIHVNVTNSLPHNGTSIHWHGIRQLNSMHMDGVNGITQCPIAPGDYFVYSFNTTQYGSSWYHSHYSVQYANGLQGPLTIHGPSSKPFDDPVQPIILTDWGHKSAFEAVYTNDLGSPSILLNGRGDVHRFNNSVTAELDIPKTYELDFVKSTGDRPNRYLLRIINTSFESTFVLSIDNHHLWMASADFVPIVPYRNTSVLIGIGQRYNVIVEASPDYNLTTPGNDDGNFWVRTWLAEGCGIEGRSPGYEKTGILRYNKSSKAEPTSKQWTDVAKNCSDELASSLVPIHEWKIDNRVNPPDNTADERFRLHFNGSAKEIDQNPYSDQFYFPLARFSFDMRKSSDFAPLQVDFADPMFFHLNDTITDWPKQWAVVPANYTDNDWVFLVLTGNNASSTFGAHPIHLHGHDFAIIKQVENETYHYDPEDPAFKLPIINPARRDVVLLPTGGYVVIAFKADNPGNWLLHCHIAKHASEGLGFQILERQADADKLWPHADSAALAEADRVCTNWKAWQQDCRHWWPGYNTTTKSFPSCHVFQDDSGI